MLAACLFAACFLFPIASFQAVAPMGNKVTGELNLVAKDVPEMMSQILNGEDVTMGQKGFINIWPLMVLDILVVALSLVCIFLYKNRVRQMRFVAVAFLLGVIEVFLIFIWAVDSYIGKVTVPMACNEIDVHYGLSTWLAIAGVVLLFLAQRSIKKDEEKVRAADRLR